MFKLFFTIARFALIVLVFLEVTYPIHAQTYDLRNDWSDINNPNGVWSYRQGNSVLSSGTYPAGDFDLAQPAWLGSPPALWLKTQSNGSGLDSQIGDVVTHTVPTNLTNVVWTSPTSGIIDINGGVWMIREIDRSNDWFLRVNGNLLSSGSIASGDIYDRSNPFNFDNGSGGLLNNLSVNGGDVLELSFQATGDGVGDYVGVELSVTYAVPEPTTYLLIITTGLCATFYLWRKRQREEIAYSS
ncbi:MAG: PEP-CTERM sorting domain-containing protein [Planctomycetia bacterium]|nr:PEP-CTERM sorting domain-containing protein [Planctomycetia bacterium]